MDDEFVVKITTGNRITIPKWVVRKLELKNGDYIAVKVVKKVWSKDEGDANCEVG